MYFYSNNYVAFTVLSWADMLGALCLEVTITNKKQLVKNG